MPTASAPDVQGVIDTNLATGDINNFLTDAEFEASQAIDSYSTALTTAEKTQLEKYLAALHIREWYERAISEDSVGDSSITYEGPSMAALRRAVDKRDPSGTLASTVIRDSDRNVLTSS